MELKINRFVNLFFCFLMLICLIHYLDEVLPAQVRIYQITNNHQAQSFSEELKINKDLNFTLLVENRYATKDQLKVLLVEVDEQTYQRASFGDRAYVYFTPIYHNIRFCLDEKHPAIKHVNPLLFRYPLDIIHFIMPTLILGMSIIGYKNKNFEVKFPLFLFASVFAVVLQWFLR